MITGGHAQKLGASWDGAGVNFALFSEGASAVELCLFEPDGTAGPRYFLPGCDDHVWHGYLPGCTPGQHYGYRVHGLYDLAAGQCFNPHKLLIDPYARQLSGALQWSPAVFGYDTKVDSTKKPVMNSLDSAAFVPKGIVQGDATGLKSSERFRLTHKRPQVRWRDTIIYELNVRGYTMRHPQVAEADRGKFRGMRNAQVLEYLKALGITSVELMPVHAYVDEQFLTEKNLRNYWGYNTINFFAPETRYQAESGLSEFRDMVNAIHDAGLEVLLDVVYNHTAEGNRFGPTLSFRGIDNASYYRMHPGSPGIYINDTGCGNTINMDHPRVCNLVHDSLVYWSQDMGVDGFRFDLAPILGRTKHGYDRDHAFFRQIDKDPLLRDVKLIAEPWDIGPGGYQVGNFPVRWSEWNDKYRDTVRSFWRGDEAQAPEFAQRLHGSADLFDHSGRTPRASVNFITSHDGYTLADLVSYEQRHNEANGESNRDGHQHNISANFGVEGETDDTEINRLRRRQRLNFLATLFLSHGTPMLLAGDEFGNTQAGNNNAYAQDNEIGWLDWRGLERDLPFVHEVQKLIGIRRKYSLLKLKRYRHGQLKNAHQRPDIEWFTPTGEYFSQQQWFHDRALMLVLAETGEEEGDGLQPPLIAILINAAHRPVTFTLPEVLAGHEWQCEFSSDTVQLQSTRICLLPDQSCAFFAMHELSHS